MGNESCRDTSSTSSNHMETFEEEVFEEDHFEEETSDDEPPICQYWIRGYCKFSANRCRFIHPNVSPTCKYFTINQK